MDADITLFCWGDGWVSLLNNLGIYCPISLLYLGTYFPKDKLRSNALIHMAAI